MFVSDRLVYLELHKTASTQIVKLLFKTIDGQQIGKHDRLEHPTDKLVVISVRNPWAWYVSLWAYGCMRNGYIYEGLVATKPTRDEVLADWRQEIAQRKGVRLATARAWARMRKPSDMWQRTYARWDDPELFRTWLRHLLDVRRRFDVGEGYGESSVSRHAGLMTYRYLVLSTSDIDTVLAPRAFANYDELCNFDREHNITGARIRTDNLEQDLVEVLQLAGYRLEPAQIERIAGAGPSKANASQHMPTAAYYDDLCIDLVRRRERLLVEKYEFEPPLS